MNSLWPKTVHTELKVGKEGIKEKADITKGREAEGLCANSSVTLFLTCTLYYCWFIAIYFRFKFDYKLFFRITWKVEVGVLRLFLSLKYLYFLCFFSVVLMQLHRLLWYRIQMGVNVYVFQYATWQAVIEIRTTNSFFLCWQVALYFLVMILLDARYQRYKITLFLFPASLVTWWWI